MEMDVRRAAGWVLVVLSVPVLALFAFSFALGIAQAALHGAWLSVLVTATQAAIAVALLVAFALVGWRMAHRVDDEVPLPLRPRTAAPVDVPDGPEVADLRLPITACPDCGFLGIHHPTLRDGVVPGGGELGDKRVCPRCGYQGLAVAFDSAEDYSRYVRSLHDEAGVATEVA